MTSFVIKKELKVSLIKSPPPPPPQSPDRRKERVFIIKNYLCLAEFPTRSYENRVVVENDRNIATLPRLLIRHMGNLNSAHEI